MSDIDLHLGGGSMSNEAHICRYLAYQGQRIELVFEGTRDQRRALMGAYGRVMLQVVLYCPFCGEDFRAECHWQIPGRPEENAILAEARAAGEGR